MFLIWPARALQNLVRHKIPITLQEAIRRAVDIERELTIRSTTGACFAMPGLPIIPGISQQTGSSASSPQKSEVTDTQNLTRRKKFGVSIAASRIIQQENVSFCNMNCVVIQTTTIILHRQRSRAAEMITKQITATAIPITGTLMAHTITIIENHYRNNSHRNNYRSRNDGGNDNRRGGGNDRSHSQSNNNQSSDQKKESSRNDHAQSSGPHENLQPKN
ncbi:unnamed protein product [Trichogramma brassicae]|uniref:Uncharacterized protein n=1 Tax=Trichogramma brassicae TaxID=86971 RepID=A0A6H5IND2_9HYME|nr:unnamed protein product [Trichogramma brassicae]